MSIALPVGPGMRADFINCTGQKMHNKMGKTMNTSIVPAEFIADRIFVVRGQKVILDADLAALYEASL